MIINSILIQETEEAKDTLTTAEVWALSEPWEESIESDKDIEAEIIESFQLYEID